MCISVPDMVSRTSLKKTCDMFDLVPSVSKHLPMSNEKINNFKTLLKIESFQKYILIIKVLKKKLDIIIF